MINRLLIRIIDLYQWSFSLDEGWFKYKYPYGYCKFTPHCSEYAKEALRKRGTVGGVWLSVWRVLRCNPWSKGGWDKIEP